MDRIFQFLAAAAMFVSTRPIVYGDEAPAIRSSWDDLLAGVKTPEDWERHRVELRRRFLELIRDDFKPVRPPLDVRVHETVDVEGRYRRLLVSYQVERDERAHAYLGIPHGLRGKAPAVVALHGTTKLSIRQTAAVEGDPKKHDTDKAFLDHLCRRGYVVIAPEHFVAGHRTPPEGAYDTTRFYEKHPEWTAVGKFTYEHSLAVDALLTREEADPERIGVFGHSLGGHGAYFLAAYDERLKATVGNCSAATFRHNPKADAWARDHWYVYLKPLRPTLLRGEPPPLDIHEIIALIAPRAYLDVSAWNDGIPATQRQRALMLLKIADVYDLVGKPENFAFYIHGRGHSVAHESRGLIYGFLDAHLKPAAELQTRLVESPTP